jgi:hypothetical protein
MSELRDGKFAKVLPSVGLRCRIDANTGAKVIATWPMGTIVRIIGEDGSWKLVSGSLNGLTIVGWSHGDYLEVL